MQVNAAKVLLLFRNQRVSDWTSLRQVIAREFGEYSLMRSLPLIVEQLLQTNLLVADNPTDYKVGNLKISDNWVRIQNVFNFSLSEMAAVDPTKEPSKNNGINVSFSEAEWYSSIHHGRHAAEWRASPSRHRTPCAWSGTYSCRAGTGLSSQLAWWLPQSA